MDTTPKANRIHIAFFGLRNAGKSTLVNEFCGQEISIVSDTPGTTTDPVSKAMEILPLGPCLITDTAGLDDDAGELGAARVAKSLKVLESADIAVWVGEGIERWRSRFTIPLFEFRRGEEVEQLKKAIAAVKIESDPLLLDGLIGAGERVICVCPIDDSAPKGRLILPQVQILRECLDRHATALICQPAELADALQTVPCQLIITDSQAFREVRKILDEANLPIRPRLTSFSILFARQKGDLAAFKAGLDAVRRLKAGDRVLIAEGCTHHRQCNDIGAVKIPKAVRKLSGVEDLEFVFASGNDFALKKRADGALPALVVHCGGCMLTRRVMLSRIAECRASDVPVVNYGILLSAAAGVEISL